MCWKLRLQVSAAGVHRPPVGGIAGTEKVPVLYKCSKSGFFSIRTYMASYVPQSGGSRGKVDSAQKSRERNLRVMKSRMPSMEVWRLLIYEVSYVSTVPVLQ
jgi:hypothetical protein